jgi:hypothetical protein
MINQRLYITPRTVLRWNRRKFAENVAVAAGTGFVGLVIGLLCMGMAGFR